MPRDEIEEQIRAEGVKPPPMITVSFRIPVEINDWAKDVSARLKVDKAVVIRKILELGWLKIHST